MPRPIWKGHISFGLVNIPVVLYSGEERKGDISFRMLDSRNNARVRYQRVNDVTGEEVPWDQIVKAYETDDDEYVLLSDEDFDRVAVEATQSVDIEDFVEEEKIPAYYYDKPYILAPGKKGEKGYVLLRETLKRTKKVGIARVVIRKRQHLAAVIPVDDALILEIMRFADELRDPAEYDLPGHNLKALKISDKELAMAEQLVGTMAGDWEPEKYRDEYRDALMAWIEQKAKAGAEVTLPEPEKKAEPAGEIVDFMTLLKKSVESKGEAAKTKTKQRPRTPVAAKTKSAAKKKAKATPKAKAKSKSKAS